MREVIRLGRTVAAASVGLSVEPPLAGGSDVLVTGALLAVTMLAKTEADPADPRKSLRRTRDQHSTT